MNSEHPSTYRPETVEAHKSKKRLQSHRVKAARRNSRKLALKKAGKDYWRELA